MRWTIEQNEARAKKARASWRDKQVRARRLLGLRRNAKKKSYREKKSLERTAFLASNPEARTAWLKQNIKGRKIALTKKVRQKRTATLEVVRKTEAFKKAHRAGLLRAVEAGKFDFVRRLGGYGKQEIFFSKKNGEEIFCASSWESKRVRTLEKDADVASYKKEPFKIRYRLGGHIHHYYPDFLVTYVDGRRVLEEVKPSAMLEFDAVKAKMMAVKAYCRRAGLTFRFLGSYEELEFQGGTKNGIK
jgi:hypothetical protein